MKATLTLAALGLALTAFAQETPTTTATPVTTTAPATSTAAVQTGPMKIGYTNVQYLLAASPQTKVIKNQLESAGKQYEKAISDKMKDLEEKFAAYQKNQGTMMESIKADKENELRTLESSIRNLQENAQSELKAKENELVKPELDKIYAAINDVAKANSYTFVLNSDQVILYAAEGSDMTSLVLKKLGYPEPSDEKPTASSSTVRPSGSTTAKPASAPAPTGKSGGAPSPSGKKRK